MATLTFHGAARTVTGSKYLLEADGAQVLVDCGLFQGLKELRELNWKPTPFDVRAVDAVVLTHAHLDHVGYLPRIVKQGFNRRIYATDATRDLAEIILLDSAKCQEQDAAYANRKGFSKHQPALPLYDDRDVERTLKLFQPVPRGEWFTPTGPIAMRFHDAGHLLGSNMIEVEIRNRPDPLRILFSGDVGRYDGPLYHDPAPPPECDYLVCESTYGDREHPETSILDALEEVVRRSVKRGGVMLIAAFAVGRAQQLLYLFQLLKSADRMPDIPIFIDSPMACDATAVYREHSEDHDLSDGVLDPEHPALAGRKVILARTAAESKKINQTAGPAVIIASSGMMTGGRIVHHLKQRMPDPRNTIIIGGYQAVGTRGRLIEDHAPFVRMFGQDIPLRAAVEKIPGLSGHADRSDLLRWLDQLPHAPKQTFLTHGEPHAADALAEELRTTRGWNVATPGLGERVQLD
ncbi:MBL fold metallo-hydrolase RNA specificity domain-containing protein [Lacipirellula sp.]|uniref:MBL fold metallo-hydrolase RNA specificity domain-containing protein n=1 Tax=Lacipirellula sp. TaxID=2691419 RepID=UPI003D0DDEDB